MARYYVFLTARLIVEASSAQEAEIAAITEVVSLPHHDDDDPRIDHVHEIVEDNTVHLLSLRGGAQCRRLGETTPEITKVTCQDCLTQHDRLLEARGQAADQ